MALNDYLIRETPEFLLMYGIEVIDDPDMSLPGIYAWSFDGRYVYVGKSKHLGKRLNSHIRFFRGQETRTTLGSRYKSVATKHGNTAKVVILVNGIMDDESLAEQELHWLDFFRESLDKRRIVNLAFNLEAIKDNVSLMSKRRKEWWKDKDALRKQRSREMSKRMKALFADPEYRAAHAERVRKQMQSRVRKAQVSRGVKAYFSNPKNRKAQSKRCKKQWKDPKFREINQERLRKLRG